MNITGRMVAALGALGLFISAFLPWSSISERDLMPLDLRSQWAFGFGGDRTTGVWLESLLFVLVAASILVLIGAITGASPVTIIGAILGGACVVAWVLQIASVTNASGTDIIDVLGPGVAAAAAGVLLAFVAGAFMRLPRKQPAMIV
jgi:hypothetical protein